MRQDELPFMEAQWCDGEDRSHIQYYKLLTESLFSYLKSLNLPEICIPHL